MSISTAVAQQPTFRLRVEITVRVKAALFGGGGVSAGCDRVTIAFDDLQSLSQDVHHPDFRVPAQRRVDTHSTACFGLGSAKLISAATRFALAANLLAST